MSVDINALKTFIAICETGSFSKAGKKLGKVQSAISSTISNLEIDLNIELFDRSKKYPILTNNGKTLLRDARDILDNLYNMESKASYLSKGNEAKVRIGLDVGLLGFALTSILEELNSKFPQTDLQIIDSNLIDTIHFAENDMIDIGIFASQETKPSSKTISQYIGKLKVVPVCHHSHELTSKKKITIAELKKYKQISITGKHISISNDSYQIAKKLWSSENGNLVIDLIRKNIGWGFVPEFLVKKHLKNKELRIIDCEYAKQNIEIIIYTVQNRNYKIGNVGKWILEELEKFYKPI